MRRRITMCLRCLTLELSGPRRCDARPGLVKMYRVSPARAWWPAVGAPLERGVRRRWAHGAYGLVALQYDRKFLPVEFVRPSSRLPTSVAEWLYGPD